MISMEGYFDLISAALATPLPSGELHIAQHHIDGLALQHFGGRLQICCFETTLKAFETDDAFEQTSEVSLRRR